MHVDPRCVWADIQAIRDRSPLIHNITNYVVMEQTANCLLAIGASPVMAHAVEEVEDMAALSSCLVINIGTLSPPWITGMLLAQKTAHAKGIPIVFDPVGSGATPFRTQTSLAILDQASITVIRGNASEIVSLNGTQFSTKGVDSHLQAIDFQEQAIKLAQKRKCIVWMSGTTDVVTDGHTHHLIHNGHPLMGKVTGMGCTASAITGAFLAVNQNPLLACAHAATLMGIAGEIAAEMATAPGSFKLAFTDSLYKIALVPILERMRVEYV